uniref:UDP-glycosyltransferase 71E1 n=1 Tax=Tanacetum cinerariifolium TaxID=118510 RepID=A0A6L2JVT7_TANCI|nr:UDP-glycosyltransferase 71E1 [Tanacetum cinerariifolium]
MGSFNEKQVKEIATALELSGQRFLWSLFRPQPKGTNEHPKEYENPKKFLPERFIERTSTEIKIDYRCDMRQGINNMTVAAEEIEEGINNSDSGTNVLKPGSFSSLYSSMPLTRMLGTTLQSS